MTNNLATAAPPLPTPAATTLAAARFAGLPAVLHSLPLGKESYFLTKGKEEGWTQEVPLRIQTTLRRLLIPHPGKVNTAN